jgi:hypothetical protein
MASPSITRLKFYLLINIRQHLSAHGELSPIRKLPFGLKNVGATFQRAMSYDFHDIKHIAEPYLDNLPAHSSNQSDHVDHLRVIFLRCRFYRILLEPHKCIFVIESG